MSLVTRASRGFPACLGQRETKGSGCLGCLDTRGLRDLQDAPDRVGCRALENQECPECQGRQVHQENLDQSENLDLLAQQGRRAIRGCPDRTA